MLTKISLSSSTAALFALLLLIEDAAYPLLVFAAAALHECGHLLAALLLRAPIQLHGVGAAGISITYNCINLSYGKELLIDISGCLTNLTAAAIAACFLPRSSQMLFFFIVCNFVLAVMNILPIRVFDGGAALSCILYRFFSPDTAARAYMKITFIAAIGLWLFAVYIQLILNGNLSLLIISLYVLLDSLQK